MLRWLSPTMRFGCLAWRIESHYTLSWTPLTPPPPPRILYLGVQSLDVLESRITGIAKSKWVMYGHFFVEVLARAGEKQLMSRWHCHQL